MPSWSKRNSSSETSFQEQLRTSKSVCRAESEIKDTWLFEHGGYPHHCAKWRSQLIMKHSYRVRRCAKPEICDKIKALKCGSRKSRVFENAKMLSEQKRGRSHSAFLLTQTFNRGPGLISRKCRNFHIHDIFTDSI